MISTIRRHALPLGFIAGLGLAFVPGGGCGGVQPAADMPVSLAGPIKACAVKHEHHLEASDHRTVKFDVGFNNGQVDFLALVESTLGDEELENCIATEIRLVTLDDFPLRRSENLESDPARPESRELLGNPAVGAAACLASPPCLLGLVVIMGAVVITVQLTVLHATTTAPVPPMAPATPTATATSTTTATPTTTAPPIATPTTTTTSPPIALPRRWPGQTCENDELDRLGDDMDKVCKRGFAAICGGGQIAKSKLPFIPCSVVRLSLKQRQACLAARWLVQDKCFDGKPDTVHKGQIDGTQNGVDHCKALELLNCAKGHPMAEL